MRKEQFSARKRIASIAAQKSSTLQGEVVSWARWNAPTSGAELTNRTPHGPGSKGIDSMKTCFELGSVSLLKRDNKEAFRVVYGLQKSEDLDYAEACKELGQCLMHQLSADGKLDD